MPAEFRDDLPLTVETPLGPKALFVLGMEGEEGLSRLFNFRMHVVAPRLDRPASVAAPIEKLIGQAASIRLRGRHGDRRVHGIIHRFVRIERPRDKDLFHFELELVPTLWLWTRRSRSRIFQRQSVPAILHAVLDELRPNVEFQLRATYSDREYCVQYRESDFAFASRLMEDEGISYYFRHEADRHVLVLVDHASGFEDLPEQRELRFDDTEHPASGTERLTTWQTTRSLQSQVFRQRDQHFELSGMSPGPPLRLLQAEQSVNGDIAVGNVKVPLTVPPLRPDAEPLEQYEHNSGFARRFEGPGGANNLASIYDQQKRQVLLREEEETGAALRIDAGGTYMHLLPGFKFAVSGLEELDGAYLLTSVTHKATQAGIRSGQEPAFTYENRVTCVPEGLPVRPARTTPKPRIDGVQTAIVSGSEGKAVDVDVFGRVRVQFHWDRRDQYNQDSSCWVRTAQMWAGNRWGSFFWPRPGMEALVTFEDGDPDRPVITGTLYNQANLPPFALPDVAAAAGIVSCTLGGDPLNQASSIVFHDQPGDEHVQIHSETHDVHSNEAWRLTHAPGGQVEFVGALPVFGSGSGGGIASWASTFGVQPDTSGSWAAKLLAYSPGKTSFCCGLNESITLGSRMTQVLVNSDVKLVSNYAAIVGTAFGSINGVTDWLSWVAGAIWNQGPSLCGDAGVISGPKTTQVYFGPKIDISRCATYGYKADPFARADWKGQSVRERVASAVVLGLDVALNAVMLAMDIITQKNGTLSSTATVTNTNPAFAQKTTEASAWGSPFGPNWSAQCIAAVMLKIDTVLATIQSEKNKAKANEATLALVNSELDPDHGFLTITERIGSIEENLSSADGSLGSRVGDLENTARALVGQAMVRNGGQESCDYQTRFSLGSPEIGLLARGASPQSPNSTITLSSVGEGLRAERKTGSITMQATKVVEMALVGERPAESGMISVESKETADGTRTPLLSMQSPKGGDIFLKQSVRFAADAIASLFLGGKGGKIQLGTGNVIAPMVAGMPPELETMGKGAEVLLHPVDGVELKAGRSVIRVQHELGIELRHGAWAIKIGPAGITLEVAENSVHFGPVSKQEGNLGEGKVTVLAEGKGKLAGSQIAITDTDAAPLRMQVV